MQLEQINVLTGRILNAAIEVHRELGPGLLESIYSVCFQRELHAAKIRFVTQQTIPVIYKGDRMPAVFRVDFVVEDTVIVEIKSTDGVLPVHKAQVLSYLRIANYPVGLLINFNSPRLMDGVKRLIDTTRDVGGHNAVAKPSVDSPE